MKAFRHIMSVCVVVAALTAPIPAIAATTAHITETLAATSAPTRLIMKRNVKSTYRYKMPTGDITSPASFKKTYGITAPKKGCTGWKRIMSADNANLKRVYRIKNMLIETNVVDMPGPNGCTINGPTEAVKNWKPFHQHLVTQTAYLEVFFDKGVPTKYRYVPVGQKKIVAVGATKTEKTAKSVAKDAIKKKLATTVPVLKGAKLPASSL